MALIDSLIESVAQATKDFKVIEQLARKNP